MLPLSEKITVLNLTRKKNHAEVAENESSIHEIEKEKEIRATLLLHLKLQKPWP